MAGAARTKAGLLRHSPRQYLVLSILAGAYVGLGIVLIFAIGAPLQAAGSGATKAVMGASFGVALPFGCGSGKIDLTQLRTDRL